MYSAFQTLTTKVQIRTCMWRPARARYVDSTSTRTLTALKQMANWWRHSSRPSSDAPFLCAATPGHINHYTRQRSEVCSKCAASHVTRHTTYFIAKALSYNPQRCIIFIFVFVYI
jgi:hypothetical protein